MEFYERVSGARMHAAFYRPNKMNFTGISIFLLEDINFFVNNAYIAITEINALLIFNKIWKQRLVNVGSFSAEIARDYNLSGVMLRSTGVKFDIRLSSNDTYANYFYNNFNSYTGTHGDCYDRYLIRINEMVESLHIVNQVTNNILLNKMLDKIDNANNNPYKNMESLIQHFKYWSEGFTIKENKIYTPVESPKGEFGVIL